MEGYDEDVREALTAAMKEKDKEPERNYVRVFAAFRAALMKEKVVKESAKPVKSKWQMRLDLKWRVLRTL